MVACVVELWAVGHKCVYSCQFSLQLVVYNVQRLQSLQFAIYILHFTSSQFKVYSLQLSAFNVQFTINHVYKSLVGYWIIGLLFIGLACSV